MVIYREFSTEEKGMQEIMKEIIIRAIIEAPCNLLKTELESNKLEISNSIIK